MKIIKYFIQFLIILILFFLFKILGLKLASYLSSKIVSTVGPIFRSKELIISNILKALPNLKREEIERITKNMWSNYGRILAEYIFIKNFRTSNVENNIIIVGQEVLSEVKKKK